MRTQSTESRHTAQHLCGGPDPQAPPRQPREGKDCAGLGDGEGETVAEIKRGSSQGGSHQQWERFESWPLGEAASQKKRRPGRSPPALMWAFPARLLPEQAADAKRLQKSAPFGLPAVGAPGDMAMLRVPGAGLEGRRWEAPGVRNSDPWSPARMVKTAWSTCRTG